MWAQTAAPKSGTATISGRVILKGEPARDVTVTLQPQVNGAPPNPDAVLRARTDGAGRFQIAAVAAGRYSIQAFVAGAISPNDSNFGGRPGQTLNVSDGENLENIDLTLKPGGVITGRVTNSQGRPLVDERITLNRVDREGRPQQFYGTPNAYEMYSTDDRGVYRIYGLSEGRYRVSVGYSQAPGSIAIIPSRTFYPRTYYPDTTDESKAQVVEVSEGFEATNIDITVGDTKRSHDIYGRVVDENGQPVTGAAIFYGAYRDGRLASSGSNGERSNANGEFRLMGVLPGKYGVFAGSDGDSDYFGDPVMCDVSEGDVAGVEIKVRQGASISGIVSIEGTNDSKTLARLSQINLMFFSRPNQNPQARTGPMRPIRVNADGSFQVRGLQQGTLEISLLSQPGLMLTRVERNGTPLREGIDVTPGENVTGVKVVLTRASLSLRGELKIIGVELPPGQRIAAFARRMDQSPQSMSPPSSAEVDARGKFVLENLAPGEYEVRVTMIYSPSGERLAPQIMRAFAAATQRVTLSGDNQPPIMLIVNPGNK
jgi:protocatechuate 3,4-dioxygenase beta subunit